MGQVWNSLWPVLGFVGAAAVICFFLWKKPRGKHGSLRVDPLSNLFVDEEDRQDDPENGAL